MSFNSPKIKSGQELLDVKPTELFKCKVFQDGNARILTEYFQLLFSRRDINLVFFGDHVHADIYATFEFDMKLRAEGNEARWDSIAIVE
jgi:hypothetical protein